MTIPLEAILGIRAAFAVIAPKVIAPQSQPQRPAPTFAERFAAAWAESEVEQFAAKRVKSSPGQQGLFGGTVAIAPARTAARPSSSCGWDEHKHPRDHDGKFANKGGGATTAKDHVVDRFMAELFGITTEEYAARKAKNSPGQLGMFGDGLGGDAPLRSAATQKKLDWITVHPGGPGSKGQPVLIDKKDGTIHGGMGGKFDGQKINDVGKGDGKAAKGDGKADAKSEPAKPSKPAKKLNPLAMTRDDFLAEKAKDYKEKTGKELPFDHPQMLAWGSQHDNAIANAQPTDDVPANVLESLPNGARERLLKQSEARQDVWNKHYVKTLDESDSKKSPSPGSKAGDESSLEYAKIDSIDSPTVGQLNAAKEAKERAKKQVKLIRDDPRWNSGSMGRPADLQLKMLNARADSFEADRRIGQAMNEIERRANELGKTIHRSKATKPEPKAKAEPKAPSPGSTSAGPALGKITGAGEFQHGRLTLDGKDVGRINFGIVDHGDGKKVGRIDDVAIDNPARGNKMMPTIYPQIEKMLKDQGATEIQLNTTEDAVGEKVWKPLGFSHTGGTATKTWAKPLDDQATVKQPSSKPATDKGKGIHSPALKNEDAKAGDQLGMFGEATRAPKKQAEFIGTKGKQINLIDGLNALPGQRSLIDEAGAPDDMVFKPQAKAAPKPEPTAKKTGAVNVDSLMKAASPYAEQGQSYNRNIAAPLNRLKSAMQRGHSQQMIDHLAEELKTRLDNIPKPKATKSPAAEKPSKGKADDDGRPAGSWKPETHLKIAADSIESLRRSDVYRLLSEAPKVFRQSMANYILKHRPELSGEIHDSQIDIAEEEGTTERHSAIFSPGSTSRYSAAAIAAFIDRHFAATEPLTIEQYRTAARPSTGSKKSDKPQIITGNKGDRGRFVTNSDGNVFFLETERTRDNKKRKREAERNPHKFVPVTDTEKAIVHQVGDHKEDVKYFTPFVDEAHAMISERLKSDTNAMQETLAQFGYTGNKVSGFISSLHRRRDAAVIPQFDLMVDYAKKHYPQLLTARPGESTAASDDEAMLFDRLKAGFPKPPSKSDPEVIEMAYEMSGIDRSGLPSTWADPEPEDAEELEEAPFSAGSNAVTERYEGSFAAVFAANYGAICGIPS